MATTSLDLDGLLQAIADPTRRRILQALKERSPRAPKRQGGGKEAEAKETGLCGFEIEKRIKLTQPTISHHMRILEQVQLVEARRDGHRRRYQRNEKLLAAFANWLKTEL